MCFGSQSVVFAVRAGPSGSANTNGTNEIGPARAPSEARVARPVRPPAAHTPPTLKAGSLSITANIVDFLLLRQFVPF